MPERCASLRSRRKASAARRGRLSFQSGNERVAETLPSIYKTTMNIIEKTLPGIRATYQKMIPPLRSHNLPAGVSVYCSPPIMLQAAPDMPAALAVLQLQKTVEGYVYLQRLNAPALWSNDKSLESIDFNAQTIVYASDSRLPYQLFPPDFMVWYLDLPVPPTIFITGKDLTAFFLRPPLSTKLYTEIATRLSNYLIKSGGMA